MGEKIRYNINFGVVTIEGIKQLVKSKKSVVPEGAVPMINNYLYIKSQMIEKLESKLHEAQDNFMTAFQLRKELMKK